MGILLPNMGFKADLGLYTHWVLHRPRFISTTTKTYSLNSKAINPMQQVFTIPTTEIYGSWVSSGRSKGYPCKTCPLSTMVIAMALLYTQRYEHEVLGLEG